MEQERPSTPEKQLLNLIEDPKEQDLSQKKIKRSSFSLFSLSALKGRLSFLLESIRSGSFFTKAFLNMKGLNRALKGCIAFLVLYLIGNFTMSVIRLKETPEFVTKGSKSSVEIPATLLSGRRISDYLEGPRSRNIFSFGDIQEVKEKEEEITEEIAPPTEEIFTKAELLIQNLSLVGIGWSDNPDVMIKNTESGKMYFLKRNQRIDGIIKVEAVFKNSVILTYDNGKEMELR